MSINEEDYCKKFQGEVSLHYPEVVINPVVSGIEGELSASVQIFIDSQSTISYSVVGDDPDNIPEEINLPSDIVITVVHRKNKVRG